jgi:hypothetical protein
MFDSYALDNEPNVNKDIVQEAINKTKNGFEKLKACAKKKNPNGERVSQNRSSNQKSYGAYDDDDDDEQSYSGSDYSSSDSEASEYDEDEIGKTSWEPVQQQQQQQQQYVDNRNDVNNEYYFDKNATEGRGRRKKRDGNSGSGGDGMKMTFDMSQKPVNCRKYHGRGEPCVAECFLVPVQKQQQQQQQRNEVNSFVSYPELKKTNEMKNHKSSHHSKHHHHHQQQQQQQTQQQQQQQEEQPTKMRGVYKTQRSIVQPVVNDPYVSMVEEMRHLSTKNFDINNSPTKFTTKRFTVEYKNTLNELETNIASCIKVFKMEDEKAVACRRMALSMCEKDKNLDFDTLVTKLYDSSSIIVKGTRVKGYTNDSGIGFNIMMSGVTPGHYINGELVTFYIPNTNGVNVSSDVKLSEIFESNWEKKEFDEKFRLLHSVSNKLRNECTDVMMSSRFTVDKKGKEPIVLIKKDSDFGKVIMSNFFFDQNRLKYEETPESYVLPVDTHNSNVSYLEGVLKTSPIHKELVYVIEPPKKRDNFSDLCTINGALYDGKLNQKTIKLHKINKACCVRVELEITFKIVISK